MCMFVVASPKLGLFLSASYKRSQIEKEEEHIKLLYNVVPYQDISALLRY